MSFEIQLENFRCFESTPFVRISPLTFFIGENSSGKTSFSAAVNILFNFMRHGSDVEFNVPPFDLGSYETIANYLGGPHGRAKYFCFKARRTLRVSNILSATTQRSTVSPTLTYKFTRGAYQPDLSNVIFEWGDNSFDAHFNEREPYIKLLLDGKSIEINKENTEQFPPPRFFISDPTYLKYLMPHILRGGRPVDEKDQKRDEGLVRLGRVYERFLGSFPQSFYSSAPVRSEPKRTYNPGELTPKSEGSHVPLSLARMKYAKPADWEIIKSKIDDFGEKSGMFRKLDVVRKGSSSSDPFQLRVQIVGRASNIKDVGYGVSQILPILNEILVAKRPTLFIFQQPEVHLHPRAQAELASLLVLLAERGGHYFIVETHSDYFIDRARIEMRTSKFLKQNFTVNYFHREDTKFKIDPVVFDDEGNITSAPKCYRSFFLAEEKRFLGI